MTLDQLETLARIVEYSSLKKAAESLHKTQPALSMALKKLEDECGFAILDRSNYRLSLTEQGKSFYRKSQELLLSSRQLSSLANHLGQGNEAKIRFSFDSSYPLPIILDVLAQTQSNFPDTEVQIIGSSRFGSLELLNNRAIDLAISPWVPTFYALGDYDSYPIGEFDLMMVCAPTLFKNKEEISRSALKQQVHIIVAESNLSFDTENLTTLKGCRHWSTLDNNTQKGMLLSGLGFGYIPKVLIEKELNSGQLIALKPNDIEYSIRGEIRIIKHKEQILGPVAESILQSFIKNTHS